MQFNTKEEYFKFRKKLLYLGAGSQGECYLENKEKKVYKIFFDCFEKDYVCYYDKSDFLKFSHLINTTFIWPNDIISYNRNIICYVSNYINAKDLSKFNPLFIDLDSLETAIKKAHYDIKYITDNDIVMYDIMYNILYNGSTLYLIDTTEYAIGKDAYQNYSNFDKSIFYFLTDGYFNDFIENDKNLSDIVNSDEFNMLYFLKEFRIKINTIMGDNVLKLKDAKKLIRRTCNKHYIR